MICLIALIVFSVLGIFSAKYRYWAKEAFNCIFRRITLRDCDTGFDRKMKMKIVGKMMKTHKGTARFVFKHFEAISWTFTVLLVASIFFSAQGVYNLYYFGSCDPHSDFCVFNPDQTGPSCGSSHCAEFGCNCGAGESNCTAENNYSACGGNCDCDPQICG